MTLHRRLLSFILVFIMVSSFSVSAKAEPMREFFTTCTYGVLAGTLVGAATLAFTNKPGDNLNNIARGASLGLYAGILLGAYIVYVVPGEDDPDGETVEDVAPEEESGDAAEEPQAGLPTIFPMITDRGIEGVGINLTLLKF